MTRLVRRQFLALLPSTALIPSMRGEAAEVPAIEFRSGKGELEVQVARKPAGRYVYADKQILRPYFTAVREPGGLEVTRRHPPVEGVDATDHATMHPGIWLGFGELGGADFWRNQGRVEHVRFAERPQAGAGEGRFTVLQRYVAPDGRVVCHETCRYTIAVRPHGYLLILDAEFTPESSPLVFGDQEEMGLGIRVATPLAVKNGGEIRNSDGKRNEREVWGKTAAWCDYSGMREGRRVGMCVMPDPANFRPSWFHARDYGVLVANPFGRKSLGGGERSEVEVKPGQRLRLCFGVLAHGTAGDRATDLPAAYADFLQVLKRTRSGRMTPPR